MTLADTITAVMNLPMYEFQQPANRLPLADMLTDVGRVTDADLVRDLTTPILVVNRKTILNVRDLLFMDPGIEFARRALLDWVDITYPGDLEHYFNHESLMHLEPHRMLNVPHHIQELAIQGYWEHSPELVHTNALQIAVCFDSHYCVFVYDFYNPATADWPTWERGLANLGLINEGYHLWTLGTSNLERVAIVNPWDVFR